MSQKKINVTEKVMARIQNGSVTMRPKAYFVAGSLLVLAGLASSFIMSVFLVALTRFSLRVHGPMGQYRLNEILTSFPWWAPAVAVGGMVLGIILLRKYDFSYKKNYPLIVAAFILAVLITGWVLDYSGWDDLLFRRGPMRGIMRQYMQNGDLQPGRMMRQGAGEWRFK